MYTIVILIYKKFKIHALPVNYTSSTVQSWSDRKRYFTVEIHTVLTRGLLGNVTTKTLLLYNEFCKTHFMKCLFSSSHNLWCHQDQTHSFSCDRDGSETCLA